MPKIIGNISFDPPEPLPGDSVLVEVRGLNGALLGFDDNARVRINGIVGSRQFIQFPRSGKQRIHIVAEKDRDVERQLVGIDVRQIAEFMGFNPALMDKNQKKMVRRAIAEVPMLQVGKYAAEPYRVSFSVGGFRVFKEGLADKRPMYKKTLEPELHRVLPGSNEMELAAATAVTAVSPAGRRVAALRGSVLSGLSGVGNVGIRSGETDVAKPILPMRNVRAVDNRTRLIPEAAKLLRNKSGDIQGAIMVWDEARAEVLVPPQPKPERTIYNWDFGDGTTARTYSARVDHDYFSALDPDRDHQLFDVTLRIEKPDGSNREVKRTLSVFNAYAICKSRGTLVPRVDQQIFADTEGFGFRAVLVVHNLEQYPISLNARRIRVMSENTDAPDTLSALTPINPLTIPARGTLEIPVSVPFTQVPKDSMGFTIYFFGNAPDGKPIRVEAFFDVRARDRASKAITLGNIAIGKLPILRDLMKTVASGIQPQVSAISADRNVTRTNGDLYTVRPIGGSTVAGRMTDDEINRRVLGYGVSRLERTPIEKVPSYGSGMVLYSIMPTPQPQEGNECDPDNLPELTQEQLDQGWTCQATPETVEVPTPARFLNALKGDVILSPGGNGLIGGLLMQVTPPQLYSHSGMMTRNYDQVTHSTASEDRLLEHPNGSVFGSPAPTDGYDPQVLKYLWPGVITQSVEQAVYGEDMVDPDGVTYQVKGFSPAPAGADVDGHWQIIPPLVVKPDPLIETPELRAKLRQVANDALSQTGNSHYRFYCYTDPSLGQRSEGVAPATAGWAAGTYPSVCSSFVWMTLKRQGISLEAANAIVTASDLEVLDVVGGAQVNEATADGLYLYTANERVAAAEWLKGELGRMVARKLEEDAGILAGSIDFFSDMSDDVANQIINTFASDWTDTAAKDSDDWKNTGEANAVSPDNILFWDSPQALGLYGFVSPLSFRPARMEEVVVHRWRKVPTKGKLSGRVFYNGQAVSAALVQVYDGKSDYTDSNGYYEIPAIPFGPYSVKVFKDNINGASASATVPVTMSQASQTLDITLQPPADAYRRILVGANIRTTDDETFSDEHRTTDHYQEVFVGPWHTHESVYFEQRMGGEIRIEVRFTVDLNMDRSVNVNVNAKMYEGTSESTNDLDDEENTTGFLVGKNLSRTGNIHLYNDEFAGGDVSDIQFTITNLVQS